MKTRPTWPRTLAPVAAAVAALTGCWGDDDPLNENLNALPGFVVANSITSATYDGNTDDLLTGGLGATGLAAATPPPVANATQPTAAELRRVAIYNNYRAIVDTSTGGGYGSLYGPHVADNGSTLPNGGKIAGTEVLAYSDGGNGRTNVILMVQIPSTFNRAAPCILTATSSGSRGVYGAIGIGEWGLKRGCAVAYTDKGTGAGPHDLQNDTVALIDGRRVPAAQANGLWQFRSELTDAERASFNATNPNRFALKHAHSQQNPEKDWGTFTLQAVEFAFYVLNERLGDASQVDASKKLRTFRPDNTLVIASSLSNGGAAAVAAAEQDTAGLIDGIAVSEPVTEMPADIATRVSVRRGAQVQPIGRHLYDHITVANLYQACASLAPSLANAPFRAFMPANAENRCTALAQKGQVNGATTAERATDALARMVAAGWDPEAGELHAIQAFSNVAPAVAIAYANAYSRSSVREKLCGYTYGAVDAAGAPVPVANVANGAALLAQSSGILNGVPPSGPINVISDNDASGQPRRDQFVVSPSTGLADWNLDGANCLRDLFTATHVKASALKQGLDETRRNGNLRGKPAVIVHGRSDALIPANHHSRPYTALNKVVEGSASQLSYVEVTNAHHFDAFNNLAGLDARFVPLHVYLNRATDAVYAKLRNGTALPPSQVVRTVPRGAGNAITAANVPPIAATPAAGDAITMNGTTLVIPD